MHKYTILGTISDLDVYLFQKFLESTPQGEPIQLEILSGGGDAFAGIAFAEKVLSCGRPTSARIMGVAASAAALIACACDEVIMARHFGHLMIHTASNWGVVDEGSKRANASQLAVFRRRMPELTQEDLYEDIWMDADEALAAGLADRIIDVTPDVVRVAASAYLKGGQAMKKKQLEMEQQLASTEETVEEKEKKKDEAQDAISMESEEPTAAILEGIAEILERLDRIEGKLTVVEEQVEDVGNGGNDLVAASMAKVYARIGRVCAPSPTNMVMDARSEKTEKKRLDSIYGDLNRFNDR